MRLFVHGNAPRSVIQNEIKDILELHSNDECVIILLEERSSPVYEIAIHNLYTVEFYKILTEEIPIDFALIFGDCNLIKTLLDWEIPIVHVKV